MRPFPYHLRDTSWAVVVLTAITTQLAACGGATQPGAMVDAASTASGDDGGDGAWDGDAAVVDATSALDAPVRQDATAGRGDDATAPPGDASMGANADASSDASEAAGSDGAPHGPSDAGPTSSMATAYLENPAHTSSVLDPSLAPPLAAIWSFEPSLGSTISYPLIARGRVYFVYSEIGSGSTAQLTAVDEHTGATLWGPVDLGVQGLAGQTYDREQVFTVDHLGVVRSFDAATGRPGWTKALSGSPAEPTAYGGLVYVASGEGVTALDETTGNVTWTATLGYEALPTSPAVTDDGVFVSAACGELSAFDRSTGALLWHHLSTCGTSAGLPMVFDGRVYLLESTPPSQVDVFEMATGALVATLPCLIPAFDDGQAYCNQREPLQAFDLTTGATNWSFSGDGQLNLVPFAAAGTVYVASDTGMMFGVDEATGAQVWSTEVDNLGASSAPVGGEGILLTQLYGSGGFVAYAHVDVPDAGVVLADGGAPVPVTVVQGPHAVALAVDDANVYWADFQAAQVGVAPKNGGSSVTLWSSTTMSPRAIAVDANGVYVIATSAVQDTPSEILGVPKHGGSPTLLATSPSLLDRPVVAGPSVVYWVDSTVERVPDMGGTPTSVPPGFTASALAVDGANLYWSALDGIRREPFSGGQPQLLAVPPNPEPTALGHYAAVALAVDATNVYYALNSIAGPGSIGSIPIGGGTPTVLASGRPWSLSAIAVDDRNVYWVEGDGTIQQGAIAAVPKTGGRVTVLVSGLSDPTTLAVDSTGIYFPSADGIAKIAK